MIDTDDLDRTLHTAFTSAADRDAIFDDPAPRVSKRVVHRRRRRIATRVSTIAVVAALAAGTIGGLYSATGRSNTPSFSPTTTTMPAVFLRPQTPADRAALTHVGDDSSLKDAAKTLVPTSLRLLQSQPNVVLYAGRDRQGHFCVILEVTGRQRGGIALGSNCGDEGIDASTRRFARVGVAESTGVDGGDAYDAAVGILVPDGVTNVSINGVRHAVTRNSVLVAASHPINLAFAEMSRHGSTVRVTSN